MRTFLLAALFATGLSFTPSSLPVDSEQGIAANGKDGGTNKKKKKDEEKEEDYALSIKRVTAFIS